MEPKERKIKRLERFRSSPAKILTMWSTTFCGGNFTVLENGVKDCSGCTVPHKKENYGYITEQFEKIRRLMEEET